MPKKKDVVQRLCALTGLSRVELFPDAEPDDDLEDFEEQARAIESYERKHGEGAFFELINILKDGGIPVEDAWWFVAKKGVIGDSCRQDALTSDHLIPKFGACSVPRWGGWADPLDFGSFSRTEVARMG